MIHENQQSVRRSLSARATACDIAIKSVLADKHLAERERNEIAECLRQGAEFMRDAEPFTREIAVAMGRV